MFRRVFLAAAVSAALAMPAGAATINYTAKLTGAKEVPRTAARGNGTLVATYDTIARTLSYTLTWDGLSGPATASNLHGPATRHAVADVLAPLGDKDPVSPVIGTVTLTEDQVRTLQTAKMYVSIETAEHPDGEIRGQLVRGVGAQRAALKKPPA